VTLFLYANNAATTLAGPIAATATSINLAAGTGAQFPSPAVGQQFALTFESQANANVREIAYCTARSGDVCTVLRGQEGTPATAFIAGDIVANDLTAGTCAALTQASQLQQQAPNYGVDTGTVNNIVVTLNPAPASLVSIAGSPIRVLVKFTNTGPTTLTITGLATTTVTAQDGSALASGQVIGGEIFEFYYNPGLGFELLSPYVLLSRANTWTGAQTLSNNNPLNWQNSTGVQKQVLNYNAANQVVINSGSGTNPFVLVSSLGMTIFYSDGTNVIIQNGLTTGGNLGVDGQATIAGNLGVDGQATIAGNLGVDGALTALGAVTFGSNISVAGTATVAPATVGGNAVRLDQLGANLFTQIALVTPSRALETIYTNTTGRPMFVSVTTISNGPAGNLFITVNGITQYTFGQVGNASITSVIGIVPVGATYGVYYTVASFTLQSWTETY
jgi:hypothetical protein